MKPHKHAELIKAWADGAEIESRYLRTDKDANVWSEWKVTYPTWYVTDDVEYRIKPEPKPDVVMYALIDIDGMQIMSSELDSVLLNVKLIFDGHAETDWKLKSAEVLK